MRVRWTNTYMGQRLWGEGREMRHTGEGEEAGPGGGVRRVGVRPGSRVRQMEVDKGSAFFPPVFDLSEDLIVRWGGGGRPG